MAGIDPAGCPARAACPARLAGARVNRATPRVAPTASPSQSLSGMSQPAQAGFVAGAAAPVFRRGFSRRPLYHKYGPPRVGWTGGGEPVQ